MFLCSNNTANPISSSAAYLARPPSPAIMNISDAGYTQNCSANNYCSPQVIYKQNPQEITYKQNVFIRWLKPPTPPPLAPIIVREIQSPPEVLPPIIYRQVAPCPPTPPPIVVREQPPPCRPPGNPLVFEKHLPRTCLPRQVIVEQCPAPPPKQPAIIYEKFLPPPAQSRQVIVQRQICQSGGCPPQQKPAPCRRLVREIIRQVPQQCCTPAQPAVVCTKEQQQQVTPCQSQMCQQLVPVYATRRHIVQPRGIRVIRQVVGPAQSSTMNIQQQQQQQQQRFSQIASSFGASAMQALPPGYIQ